MQNKTKRLSVLLGLALGAPAVVAPVVMPSHAPAALAQESAEYPDVPQNHWAYAAINKLSKAGIIEGMPNGTYMGNRPMTRYEFAVAVARILEKTQAPTETGTPGTPGAPGQPGPVGPQGKQGPPGTIPDVSQFVKKAELTDAINALRNEFAPELKALGVRVDDLDKRVTDIENRLAKPPKLTVTPSVYLGAGSANYLSHDGQGGGPVRVIPGAPLGPVGIAANNNPAGPYVIGAGAQKPQFSQFSYLDFSLRLADRVSDNVTLNAELRSLSGTTEDPWAGEFNAVGGAGGTPTSLYVREANADVKLNNLELIAGRQHTKVAQGLLYDNDFAPTDQIQGIFSIGPVNVDAFIGSASNNTALGGIGGGNPYLDSGAAWFIGADNTPLGGVTSGALAGFPGASLPNYNEDSESLVRGSLDLFKIAGKPVQLGASYLLNGIGDQKGWGADVTVPLFNRNVGIEYVDQKDYSNSNSSNGSAYNITVPVLRTDNIDLTVAYGKASDDFEYFLSSAANPYARTYGEAIFDRPLALGAPLINGSSAAGTGNNFMAAKKVWDINGTLRFIKKFPISLRYYTAKGTNDIKLGDVWSVGTNYQLTQGLDLELKYGQYNPDGGNVPTLKYFRIGANVGF